MGSQQSEIAVAGETLHLVMHTSAVKAPVAGWTTAEEIPADSQAVISLCMCHMGSNCGTTSIPSFQTAC